MSSESLLLHTHMRTHVVQCPLNTIRLNNRYVIKLSLIEIYNEQVKDLLNPKAKSLKIRETEAHGVWIDGVTEVCVYPRIVCAQQPYPCFVLCAAPPSTRSL